MVNKNIKNTNIRITPVYALFPKAPKGSVAGEIRMVEQIKQINVYSIFHN